MNIYTGDVFINNYSLCIWRINTFIRPLNLFTDDDFGRPKQKKIVALMSKHPVAKFTTLVRDGKSNDFYIPKRADNLAEKIRSIVFC
jgi:hypothetical protein